MHSRGDEALVLGPCSWRSTTLRPLESTGLLSSLTCHCAAETKPSAFRWDSSFRQKSRGEDMQPSTVRWPCVSNLERLSFLLFLGFLFLFFWFKPQQHTTQRQKEMQKSLRAGTKRPLTMVLVHAFWSFTSSKWGPWRLEGGWAPEPRPANAHARLAGPGPCCARWTRTRRTVDYFLF